MNYYEAQAFCRWKALRSVDINHAQTAVPSGTSSSTLRLLTEAEHHVLRHDEYNLEAARKGVIGDKVMHDSGHIASCGNSGANLNLAFSSQTPVDAFPPSSSGHHDVSGSSWEWVEDHFNPLENFEVHPLYDDFSTPCFDGKHNMIVGGSFISTGDEASVFARFHFRPHFLQHSGFRLVSSNHEPPVTNLPIDKSTTDREQCDDTNHNTYETDESLQMYLGLHYPYSGATEGVSPIIPHSNSPDHCLFYPQRIAQLLVSLLPRDQNTSALDIGCAVGGASFELAKHFHSVDAFDYSKSFIDVAKKMKYDTEEVNFRVSVESDIHELVRAVHAADVNHEVKSKLNFFTGDACKLGLMKSQGLLGTYDGLLMSNLLCRLSDPVACLNGLASVVAKQGVVVLISPFSWLVDFTPRDEWLGGYYSNENENEAVWSKNTLKQIMESNGFEMIHEQDIPLVIREHSRKYQYIVSHATGWRKNS